MASKSQGPDHDPIDVFSHVESEQDGSTVVAIYPVDVPDEELAERCIKSDLAVTVEDWR